MNLTGLLLEYLQEHGQTKGGELCSALHITRRQLRLLRENINTNPIISYSIGWDNNGLFIIKPENKKIAIRKYKNIIKSYKKQIKAIKKKV